MSVSKHLKDDLSADDIIQDQQKADTAADDAEKAKHRAKAQSTETRKDRKDKAGLMELGAKRRSAPRNG